jgi:hypothetical protein
VKLQKVKLSLEKTPIYRDPSHNSHNSHNSPSESEFCELCELCEGDYREKVTERVKTPLFH